MDLFPKYPHSAIICGQTGCGKTVFILDLLEERYIETFAHIVILCPTVRWNKTYHSRSWVWTDPQVFIVDPGDRLQEYLRAFYSVFAGESTLYIIDDCSASKALTKKKDMLSELAFSKRGCVAPTRGAPEVRQNPPPPWSAWGCAPESYPCCTKGGPKMVQKTKCARTPIVYTTQVRKKKGRKAEYQMCIVMQTTS